MTKLFNTASIALNLFLARTYGHYVCSGWNGEFEYARYRWRGKEWCIPTGPYEASE